MAATTATTLLLGACAAPQGDALYRQAAGVRDDPKTIERLVSQAEDLTVVDCLLPGKMRRMGRTITWVTRPRPVKMIASECEILGGQYILFDRANPDTALAVWRSAADAGDATAQTYVGEIYERGLGRPRDYTTAAQWYRKAADQGYPRAQLLLGTLYEKGLGVERDPVQALEFYRKAAGLTQDKVVYLAQALAAARPSPTRAAPVAAPAKAPDRAMAKAQFQQIRAARSASDHSVRKVQTQVAQAKEEVVRSGRTKRMIDQPTPEITTRKRLIDQYVAVSQQAESQKLVMESQRRIETLAEPVVAQQ
ncbi:tetratricopeptide repeat protein [uncultured Thiodictyon sp.]|jgi:hypothetical protein|uniref:tetratricopeptide repeat protein n=1 Tax=uncultured Thiodictyon sp. TaxID=1846217 RepID=UPI0025EB28E7|nr:tetratricopeptide repeat protein [uncultured Thiodictyon sp.]